MAQDAEKRIEQRRDELMEREMKAWEREAKGSMTKLKGLLGRNMAMNFSFHTYNVGHDGDDTKNRHKRLGGLL